MSSCENDEIDKGLPRGNAVYYWRTSLTLSQSEKQFLKDNKIETVYLHLFDIVKNKPGDPLPNSTLRFVDTIPSAINIVPTVFISEGTLKDSTINLLNLANKIVKRCDDMMTQNDYPLPQELQIDYDWAQSDRKAYFTLLENIGEILHKDGRRLSATIRLHQLSQAPPQVDYGSLMVYNIGNFADIKESNSIISVKNLLPYLRYLHDYKLPLALALPAYSWDLLFHKDKFNVIARGLNITDSTEFKHVSGNLYRALNYSAVPMSFAEYHGARIYPGDIIRHETSDYEVIDSVAKLILSERADMADRIIIYHLDDKCLDVASEIFKNNKNY